MRIALLGGMAVAIPLAQTGRAQAAKPEIYTGLVPGVAAGGFDVVAYFRTGKPIKGDPKIVVKQNGALWFFSSVANRDAFAAEPERFSPQYGGYCAWAVASGYTAKGDPNVWRIVDGKLYLNYSKGVQRRWEGDIPGNIANGDRNWPGILN